MKLPPCYEEAFTLSLHSSLQPTAGEKLREALSPIAREKLNPVGNHRVNLNVDFPSGA